MARRYLGSLTVAFIACCVPFVSGIAHAQIVALGASTTEGYGVGGPPGAFPARLQALLKARGYNVSVTNAGISGDTTWGMLTRLGPAVPLGTKIVILEEWGGYFNDLRNGISLQQGRTNVAEIMSWLGVRNIRVIPFRSLRGLPRGPDGLHLSSEGQAMLARELLPQIISVLDEDEE